MGLNPIPWIKSLFSGQPSAAAKAQSAGNAFNHAYQQELLKENRDLRMRYEGATTNSETAPLWGLVDYLSAKAANSYQVRRVLKIRSRYESCNNSYFRGIIDSIARDLIGTGPRLRVYAEKKKDAKLIHHRWHEWTRAIGFTEKLHTLCKGKIQDGEGFGMLVNNKTLRRTLGTSLTSVNDAVQLDFVPFESDQCWTPDPGFLAQLWVDGMELDRLGYPKWYHITRTHPGDLLSFAIYNPNEYDKYPPNIIAHWFRKDRPGQVRGVPEITPALDLFAQLRRYTKAVLAAAETAADFAAVVKTQLPADANLAPPQPWTLLPIDRGAYVTLPWGTDVNQLKAEQPTTTYESFVRILLREICRCLNIPLGIAMGDFSGYNYSSGRLDSLGYHRGQRVDRKLCENVVVEKVFDAWLEEAVMIPGYLPAGITSANCPHRWYWDASESIDPVKDEMANQLALANNTDTLANIWAVKGETWDEMIKQRKKEMKKLAKAGLDPASLTPNAAVKKVKAAQEKLDELDRMEAEADETSEQADPEAYVGASYAEV
jgi:lambda family phage portal protein